MEKEAKEPKQPPWYDRALAWCGLARASRLRHAQALTGHWKTEVDARDQHTLELLEQCSAATEYARERDAEVQRRILERAGLCRQRDEARAETEKIRDERDAAIKEKQRLTRLLGTAEQAARDALTNLVEYADRTRSDLGTLVYGDDDDEEPEEAEALTGWHEGGAA